MERGKDRWEAGVGGAKGPGETTGDRETDRDREETVTLISLSCSRLQRFPFMCKK